MKLIFNIVQSNVKGGMEKVFMDYSHILGKSDYDLICLTSKGFPDNKTLDQQNIKRINFNINGHFDILATIKLFILIKQYNPSLIIAHNGRVFATLNLLKTLFRIKTKVLAVSHGGNIKRLLNFDCAIGVAKHIVTNIKNHNFKGKALTIYNGTKIIKNFKRKKSDKIFRFGIMSRLSEEKNIPLAIESFAKFLEKQDKNSELIIAGNGVQKKDLVKLTQKLKIENKVKFIGWIDKKDKFFNTIDIFIQSSNKESFGIAIIEAFNHHCPVIASNALGPQEIIKANKNGYLFDLKKDNSLFLKMDKSYKERKNLETITKNAHKDLIEKFSFEKMSNSLLKFINEILKQ